jgi:hypothetical protein
MKRNLFLSAFFLSGCSIFVQKQPFCGDGIRQDGEVCFRQELLNAQTVPTTALLIDLDNDEDLDIVNSNFAGEITFFANDGTGAFDDFEVIETQVAPSQMVSGDLNGDGLLDLAAACSGFAQNGVFPDGILSLEIQQADGTFLETALPQLNFTNFQTLAIGDFESDGDLDLSLIGTNTQQVRILTNDGLGNFTQAFTINLQSIVLGASMADLDSDGLLELILSEQGFDTGVPSDKLLVFTGAAIADSVNVAPVPTTITVNTVPTFNTVADLNDDGLLDLISADGFGDTLSIVFQNAPLSFDEAIQVNAGNGPLGVVTADINDDGRLDIVSTAFESNEVFFHVNVDGVSFTTLAPIPVGANPELLSVGDVDGDGLLDVLVPNADLVGLSNTLSLLRGAL